LLAAFRAVYGGLKHDDVYIPAYGGNLFNPDRFPFLEGRKRGTSWKDSEANPLPVNNRTVLHLLKALQFLETKAHGSSERTPRRLSFRALDIEQIGHVYEGLLDHTAKRATEPFLGLAGTRDKEPELPLAKLEALLAKGEADLVKFLEDETGRSDSALKRSLKAELDQQDATRFRTACQSDDALWKRVEPLAGLVRQDNFGYPVVIPKGSVFVTAGTDRRSSGTQYTPRSLTEPIVQYTLEPLVYVGPAEGKPKGEWKLRSASELLNLKICDMACGSGAFLVQAARYMAERLLEAWDYAKQANPNTPGITPEGMPSTGKTNEALLPDDPAERKTYAMRIVAQRCLYGVEKNPLAAEMAKLSLWLLTLAKDKPFEFLDHSIRCGDSLVGLHSIDQLRHFSLKQDADDAVLFGGPFEEAVEQAIHLRLKLEDMPANTVDDVQRQENLLIDANEKIARLRYAADLLVAAQFWGESTKDRLERVRHAAVKSGYYVEKGPTEEFEQVAAKERRGQTMFHWPLEFPEVIVKQGGFDAFVGNPPFMGGKIISTNLGVPLREHIVELLACGTKGHADLCAYFLLRGCSLLRGIGVFGVIATNTISEGDSREVALDQLVMNGTSVIRAVKSTKWPGQANLEVAHIWLGKGEFRGQAYLNGSPVAKITPFLTEAEAVHGRPYALCQCKHRAFIGTVVYGEGFVLGPDQAQDLTSSDTMNGEVIRPYMNGDDINSTPHYNPSRFVIDFGERSLEEARRYHDCFAIVERLVKPYRQSATEKRMREKWWLYQRPRPALYAAISKLNRSLMKARVSEHHMLVFTEEKLVVSDQVVVFALDRNEEFAVLQSNVHEAWARFYSSSLETRLRYAPSDCFETFPFPSVFPPPLSQSGESYYEHRERLLCTDSEGLTKLYNRFHDPDDTSADIQKLRDLHIEMDQAVSSAYGWMNFDLGHGFHETRQGVRFTISESARREVLQCLLKLNHERYAEEVKQGLHPKMGAAKKASPKKKAASKPAKPEASLFDGEDDE
jgi:hypothetical protein